jgi:ABC-2 type transport system ATP-binding protein
VKQNILKISNLTKRYQLQAAVDHVSMSIEKGDIYGLIGQNGAGKTPLIRLITSLISADSGEIQIMGKNDPGELAKARARIGSIVEAPAFYPNLTAQQNLEYYRLQRGIPDKACITDSLKLAGLTDTGRKKFKNFSLGMKQRLGIALAILNHPDFIILDEPINGLDPTGIIEMRETLRFLNSQGITILISSHILSELAQIATRYGFIHKGRLIKEITDGQLKEACRRALHITVDNTVKASSVLDTLLHISDYKVISANEIRVYSHLNNPSEVAGRLFQNGVSVSSIHEVGDTLEDYYTALIKEEK